MVERCGASQLCNRQMRLLEQYRPALRFLALPWYGYISVNPRSRAGTGRNSQVAANQAEAFFHALDPDPGLRRNARCVKSDSLIGDDQVNGIVQTFKTDLGRFGSAVLFDISQRFLNDAEKAQ